MSRNCEYLHQTKGFVIVQVHLPHQNSQMKTFKLKQFQQNQSDCGCKKYIKIKEFYVDKSYKLRIIMTSLL